MSGIINSLVTKISSNIQLQFHNSYRHSSTAFRKDSTHKETELSQYIIVKATKDDYVPVLRVMHSSFYPDEPTCSCLGIGPNSVMDERTLMDMAEGMSLLARLKYGGDIVGACVNSSIYPWDPDQTEKLASSCKCNKLKTLLLFYAHMTRRPDFWKSYGVKKVFEMAYVFVKPEHRNKGISFRLMQDSRKLAADKGFQIIRCDATNFVTARICEKLGMRLVDEIPFSSYLGKNFEPVFKPPPPHESVKIYMDDNLEEMNNTTNTEKKKEG